MWSKKRLVGIASGLVVVGLLAAAFLPEGVEVEIGQTVRGPLKVTVSGTGKARVKERYTVSASVTGRIQRMRLEAGDVVAAGDVLAQIAPAPLDERTEAEVKGRLSAARGAEAEARSALERARLAEKRAESDWKRTQMLIEGETISAQQYEAAKLEWQARTEEVKMAGAALRRARGEAQATRALLSGAGSGDWAVRAPSAGCILRVFQESEGVVSAGTPLVEIGDLSTLEVTIDLLTTQAVRVRPGARVEVTQWGGDRMLSGKVRRVEPSAFTKVSALGIEEQRINVIVEPVGGSDAWSALGDGYRVEANVVVDERPDALKVALGSLFRRGDDWAVFTVADGRARLKTIRLGESDGSDAEVKGGLSEGDRVVLHPSDKLSDGARVKVGG